jgi:hypothetical protein
VVHLIRASMRFIGYQDRKKVAAALRPVYTAPTADAAQDALDGFEASELRRPRQRVYFGRVSGPGDRPGDALIDGTHGRVLG